MQMMAITQLSSHKKHTLHIVFDNNSAVCCIAFILHELIIIKSDPELAKVRSTMPHKLRVMLRESQPSPCWFICLFPTCVILPSLCYHTVFLFHPQGVPHLVSEILLMYQKRQQTTHCAQAADADFMLLFHSNNSYRRPHTPTLSTVEIKWL